MRTLSQTSTIGPPSWMRARMSRSRKSRRPKPLGWSCARCTRGPRRASGTARPVCSRSCSLSRPAGTPSAYPDDRGVAEATPGPCARRSHRLAGLVLKHDPAAALRRGALTRGQTSFFHSSTASSSRSMARRTGCCQDQPCRLSSRTCPPPCRRRGTAARSASSPAPASTAGPPTREQADRAPVPAPAWRSARGRVSGGRASPSTGHQPRRVHARPDATAPPTARSPANDRDLPALLPRPKRSTASSRIRSRIGLPASVTGRPARISRHRATAANQPPAGEPARHHPIKFSSRGPALQGQ